MNTEKKEKIVRDILFDHATEPQDGCYTLSDNEFADVAMDIVDRLEQPLSDDMRELIEQYRENAKKNQERFKDRHIAIPDLEYWEAQEIMASDILHKANELSEQRK